MEQRVLILSLVDSTNKNTQPHMDYHFITVTVRYDLEIFSAVTNETRKDDKKETCNTLEESGNQIVSKRTGKENITAKYLAWFGGLYQSGF
jgi:hypothetical protein